MKQLIIQEHMCYKDFSLDNIFKKVLILATYAFRAEKFQTFA